MAGCLGCDMWIECDAGGFFVWQRNTAVDTLNCSTCGITMNCTIDDTRKAPPVISSAQLNSATRTVDPCASWSTRVGRCDAGVLARVILLLSRSLTVAEGSQAELVEDLRGKLATKHKPTCGWHNDPLSRDVMQGPACTDIQDVYAEVCPLAAAPVSGPVSIVVGGLSLSRPRRTSVF